jgi:DNA-binding response OmpR family regulator
LSKTDFAKIMVIDDEQDVLKIVELYLEKWNYQVDPFSSSLQALEKFKQKPSEYSLILSDVRMPGLDGVHLAQEIQKVREDANIILMTAFEMDEYVTDNLPTIKKEDILKKPFKLNEVCSTVKKHLKMSY